LEVDVDELCAFPGGSLPQFLSRLAALNMTYALGRLVDRFSDSGTPDAVQLGGRSIWEQFPRR